MVFSFVYVCEVSGKFSKFVLLIFVLRIVMDALPLTKSIPPANLDNSFDISKCIICQSTTKDAPKSTPNGRTAIMKAASIRQDVVLERLENVEDDFVYHISNSCYKKYTMVKTLESIKSKRKISEQFTESVDLPLENKSELPRKKTRSSDTPRSGPSSEKRPERLRCVVCNKGQNKSNSEKFRLCECPRAKLFLDAATYFQDEIYTRIADVEDVSRVFGADLFYHSSCMHNYLGKYTYQQKKSDSKNCLVNKRQLLSNEIFHIDRILKEGNGIAISDIRDLINENNEIETMSNKEVELYLTEHYGERIQFSKSSIKNQSTLVFSSELSVQNIIEKVRSTNVIKEAASSLRNVIMKQSFHIDDKYCDADELSESWQKTLFPDEVMTFFSSFFNIKKSVLSRCLTTENFDPDIETRDPDWAEVDEYLTSLNKRSEKLKSIKLMSLYQMMYFILHNGKKDTPLHIMTAHSIWEKCKSKELITTFNHLGVCRSYKILRM